MFRMEDDAVKELVRELALEAPIYITGKYHVKEQEVDEDMSIIILIQSRFWNYIITLCNNEIYSFEREMVIADDSIRDDIAIEVGKDLYQTIKNTIIKHLELE